MEGDQGPRILEGALRQLREQEGESAWESQVPLPGTSLVPQRLRIHLSVQEMQLRSLGREDPLEEKMETHSSILTWKIPRAEETTGYRPWGCKESNTTERLTL